MQRLITRIVLAALLVGWLMPPPAPVAALAPGIAIPPLDGAPFGLNTHLATRYWLPESMNVPADTIAAAGVGWAREDIHWFRIQPTPDTWDWSFNDRAISLLNERRVQILGVIGHPPGWATPYGGDQADTLSFYAADPQRFAAFAGAVAQRYAGIVQHWEIWNEPDNPLFWKPAPDARAYAELLRATSAAIRAIDPQAQILIGGISPFSLRFLRGVADAGAWESFDLLAVHPYVMPWSPENANLVASLDAVRAFAAERGAKPIWVTEYGWSSGPGDGDPVGIVDRQRQADYLVRGALALWQAGVERIFWYTLKDDPGNPFGLFAEGEGYQDYQVPKPAYRALAELNRQLAGAEYVGVRDLFAREAVVDFERFGVWRRGDQPNGTFTPTQAIRRTGTTAAALSYRFDTLNNDFVVFRSERALPVLGAPTALGIWAYGDGSGHTLKIWLRDAEDEVLQYTLGAVGQQGWRFMQTPLRGAVFPVDRISGAGNGIADAPIRIEAIVLDDASDEQRGTGTVYLDDLTAFIGPEAYDLQLRRGDERIDVLWAPMPIVVSIESTSTNARVSGRDGASITMPVRDGRLVLTIGPSPQYVRHRRP